MKVFFCSVCACGFALLAAAMPAPAADPPAAPRIEARSANLLAVGIVHGDRMSVHLTRMIDNAPVRDAVVTISLRGIVHPTVAEADGSYTLQTKDLGVPGSASIELQVVQGQTREDLKGTLVLGDSSPQPTEKNSARQLWWWVLNFAVCTGFLLLISRRRKAAPRE
ncbi:MAG TPA: hypothetical protein VNR70_06755 [Steroidobacteraceae bacterium]|nr:hypothetical protein [Steroidobacteraceae bacterium]